MERLSCRQASKLVPALHDGELSVARQIAVDAHVGECRQCARQLARLRAIRHGLRRAAGSQDSRAGDLSGLQPSVVGRLQAETAAALSTNLRSMFEDMHFVWAALAATGASVACAVVLFGMMRFANPERADSLAGLMEALAAPGSDANPVSLDDQRILVPRVSPDNLESIAADDRRHIDGELLLTMAAVVTQEGRIAGIEVLLADEHDRDLLFRLLSAASATRFEPARFGGAPVAVNMVWLVSHSTVHGQVGVPEASSLRALRGLA